MTQDEWSETQASSPSGRAEGLVHQERRAAEGLVDDAKAAASEATSQAKKLASDKADELQGAAASHLRSFADAVRAAGDELADKEPGPVSDLVRQAAEGLERFSGALGRKSAAEMVDSVRDFGRQSPMAFLAGSMLAGFALARVAGAATSSVGSQGYRDREPQRAGDTNQNASSSDFGGNAFGRGASSFSESFETAGAERSVSPELSGDSFGDSPIASEDERARYASPDKLREAEV